MTGPQPAATTSSRVVGARPAAVLAVLADPRRIPEWAPAFADAVDGGPDAGWSVTKDGRTFPLQVTVDPAGGTVAYLREVSPGRTGGARLRVDPVDGDRCEVTMSVPLPPDDAEGDVRTVLDAELDRLAQLVTGSG
ncbi:SRPBCC family protein [Pseudonocardia nematodicida]|uniref:SRPBCC family protein n=1 Tax=Pseudonocardia nematodicida TaxID=1206997 RepID=A0ABV1KD65_9PSEU